MGLCASLVSAVFLQDAFVKDWVNYHYGNLGKYQLTSDESLVAITGFNQLVSIELQNEGRLRWSFDLEKLPSEIDDFQIANRGKIIYGYSKNGNQVYSWESGSGVLIERFILESAPKKIETFDNMGLLVLGSNGDLQLLRVDGKISSLVYKHAISDFKSFQHDGLGYILTDDGNLVSINPLGEISIVKEDIVSFSKIKAVGEGILISSDHKLYNIADLSKPVSSPFKLNNVEVVNTNYFVDYKSSDITLYREENESIEKIWSATIEESIIALKVEEHALSTLVIASTASGQTVFDITDTLASDDSDLVQKHQYDFVGGLISFSQEEAGFQSVSSSLEFGELRVEKYSFSSKNVTTSKIKLEDDFALTPTKAILVDKPKSQNTIAKVHHLIENAYSFNLVQRWVGRVKRHLAELGRFAVSITNSSGENQILNQVNEDAYGFGKILIYADSTKRSLIALDTSTGGRLWKTEISTKEEVTDILNINSNIYVLLSKSLIQVSVREGTVLSTYEYNKNIEKVFKISIESGIFNDEPDLEPVAIAVKFEKSNSIKIISNIDDFQIKPDQFLIQQLESAIEGYKVLDEKLIPTWKFSKDHSSIISVSSKPEPRVTSSIGIARFDKSVLYKYLNPNFISIISQDKNTQQLSIDILDGISGSVLYTHVHDNEIVDVNSINLVEDDNWIIYTYFIKSPKLEQRIIVIDLFDTFENAIGDKQASVLNNEYNSTINQISKKSFIFPERIISIKPSQTKFGITLKSIIALTETGNLLEIPKFILNSRRIDDKPIKPEDLQDEFRIMPYDPIIYKNTYQVLNHKLELKLDHENEILVKPTELESTSVVCFINKYNDFCTLIQPSLSYDLLSSTFNKVKLSLTILVLLIGYLITKPMVMTRKLNSTWIDRE